MKSKTNMEVDTEKINIRKATLDDANILLNLIDALAEYEKLEKPSPEAKERLIRDTLGDFPRVSAWLGEYEGKVVGYAIIFFTYSTFLGLPSLFIEDIFVMPEYRNKGVGYALYKHCATLALSEGCGRMEWVVLNWNKSAIDFYKKHGAEELNKWVSFRMTREKLLQLVNG